MTCQSTSFYPYAVLPSSVASHVTLFFITFFSLLETNTIPATAPAESPPESGELWFGGEAGCELVAREPEEVVMAGTSVVAVVWVPARSGGLSGLDPSWMGSSVRLGLDPSGKGLDDDDWLAEVDDDGGVLETAAESFELDEVVLS
jgi:hypothetical protein